MLGDVPYNVVVHTVGATMSNTASTGSCAVTPRVAVTAGFEAGTGAARQHGPARTRGSAQLREALHVKFRVCTTVAVPPDQLWGVLERVEDHVDWMADARSITFVGSQRRGVGTEFDCLTAIGPLRTTDRMMITEWEPRRAMGVEHRGLVRRARPLHARGGAAGADPVLLGGTAARSRGGWAGRSVRSAAKPVLRAVWRRNLARLQRSPRRLIAFAAR